MVTINFITSKERELRRVLFHIAQIKRNFYQENNYLLFLEPKFREGYHIPELVISKELFNYLKNEFGWKHFDSDYWFSNYNEGKIPKEYRQLLKYIEDSEISKSWDTKPIKKVTEILSTIHDLKDITINISPTNNGTGITFRPLKDNVIEIYARKDVELYRVLTGIIGSFESFKTEGKISWDKRTAIRDYFLDYTIISKYSLKPELKEIENSSKYFDLYNESKGNFADLGFPLEPLIKVTESRLEIDEYGEVDFLTSNEHLVLYNLVCSPNEVLTFDAISKLLWNNEEYSSFSLQAISKTVERIRKKLKDYGIQKQIIFTKRNEGYFYYE